MVTAAAAAARRGRGMRNKSFHEEYICFIHVFKITFGTATYRIEPGGGGGIRKKTFHRDHIRVIQVLKIMFGTATHHIETGGGVKECRKNVS